MKNVLLVVAHQDFQPVEYRVPKDILQASGIQVKTASDNPGVAISTITGEKATVDLVLEEVRVEDFDGIFFVGGPGAAEFLNNDRSYRIIREVAASGKKWGAICISPRILAAAGVLKNRKVTGWDGDNELAGVLSAVGAEYVREPVVVDGDLITASGPSAAEGFGNAILKSLI